MLFAKSSQHGLDLGILVRCPLVAFNKALECAARVTVLGLSVRLLPRFLPPRATNQQKSDTDGFSATLA